nr:hypothetical protein Q903MT_gene5283 [Picea sitchensis]
MVFSPISLLSIGQLKLCFFAVCLFFCLLCPKLPATLKRVRPLWLCALTEVSNQEAQD